jgi:hypothetical protein
MIKMEKLNKVHVDLLDELLSEESPHEIVADYVMEHYPVSSQIYDLSLDTLIKSLYIGYELDPDGDVNIEDSLALELARELSKSPSELEGFTVDDFFEKFNVPVEYRSDFAFASIMREAFSIMDKWEEDSNGK